MTYSLALTLFFVITAFYFYLYSTAKIDFIDKRIEKLFPISPLELPKASAKVLTPKTPSQMIHSPTPSDGSVASVDIQYSNLLILSSEFEHRNRCRQRLKDGRNTSNYPLWDRHIVASSPISHTASKNEDKSSSFAANLPRPGIEDDTGTDTAGYSVQQQEEPEMSIVNQSNDRLEHLNNLSFYNGECSVTGLLEDSGYDFEDITMMSNPFKRSQRNEPDGSNTAVCKNDTTILFGSQRTDEGNHSESSNTRDDTLPEEDTAALDRRLSAKRKLGYYLNKLSPPQPSSNESVPAHKHDPLDINLTRRQTLSYYMKKLDPATMSYRKRLGAQREASSKDNNNASHNADLRASLVQEANDASREQELDEDR
jgi:hypothetical protein